MGAPSYDGPSYEAVVERRDGPSCLRDDDDNNNNNFISQIRNIQQYANCLHIRFYIYISQSRQS